mmetsp:Transcript_39453/g.105863  ORF Transcript_39453/g.105863 Transcript_39453/m.105863 type:complete len:217 (+) Transcript_39453:101-751(+)
MPRPPWAGAVHRGLHHRGQVLLAWPGERVAGGAPAGGPSGGGGLLLHRRPPRLPPASCRLWPAELVGDPRVRQDGAGQARRPRLGREVPRPLLLPGPPQADERSLASERVPGDGLGQVPGGRVWAFQRAWFRVRAVPRRPPWPVLLRLHLAGLPEWPQGCHRPRVVRLEALQQALLRLLRRLPERRHELDHPRQVPGICFSLCKFGRRRRVSNAHP